VHATGFLHRDIKPDNIFIRADGRPVLIDFGAARQAMGGETKSLTSILTPGYAPLEQYSGEGKQGPWTDLYAMGGVLYRAVVDKNPPDAVSRIRGDSLAASLAAARGKYSEDFLRAIEWSVHLDEKKRPQSVEQWKPAVLAERRMSAPAPRSVERRIVRPVAIERPRRSRWPLMVVIVLLAVAAGGIWKKQWSKTPEPVQAQPAAPATPVTLAPPVTPTTARAAPSEDGVQDKFPRAQQRAELEFRSADANGDGYLSREEVKARFPFLATVFSRIDTDGDGRLSQREFLQAKRILLERRFGK
jgi:serine/threonine protein kinase